MSLEVIMTVMTLINIGLICLTLKYQSLHWDNLEMTFTMAFLDLIVLMMCLVLPFLGIHSLLSAIMSIVVWGISLYVPIRFEIKK